MNNKFLREARESCFIFCTEYKINEELAKSNLKKRLENKRKRIKDMTMTLINNRIFGVEWDD